MVVVGIGGAPRDGVGGRGEAPEGVGEMSQSVLERVSDIDLLR